MYISITLSHFSNAQVEKAGNPPKIRKLWKNHQMNIKQSAMKLSQICQRIELCLQEIILRYEMNLYNLLFSWQFKSYLKQVLKYLATWLCYISFKFYCKFMQIYKVYNHIFFNFHVHLLAVDITHTKPTKFTEPHNTFPSNFNKILWFIFSYWIEANVF
jgi:hypothetical protein